MREDRGDPVATTKSPIEDNGGFGSDPTAIFGDDPQPTVERTGGREYYFDGGDDIGAGSGSGNVGDADRYERDSSGNIRYNKDGSPRKKRGRAKGYKLGSRAKKSDPVLNISGIEKLLLSIHGMAAAFTKTPELTLETQEATSLAEGIADVAQYYPLDLAPEVLAWCNLFMIAIPIYGSRVYLVVERKKEEKAQKARNVRPTAKNAPVPTPAPQTPPPHGPRAGGGFPEFNPQG
jgi:hypothetical protein